ncbi:MAG: Peptidase family [Modestobacter sp.]|nr:Peptidase family [Modestobacter sp.]
MSRQNDLADRSWAEPATAGQAAVGLIPRPRISPGTARGTDGGDTATASDQRLAGPVDRDSDWAGTHSTSTDDPDDEYFDVIELPQDTTTDDAPVQEEATPRRSLPRRSLPRRSLPRRSLSRRSLSRRSLPRGLTGGLPTAPRRRPALLLAAVVAGALIAGATGGLVGPGSSTPTASGQDYGLGMEETGFAGGVDIAGARGEISQAEAQARLDEIAASRAARQPAFVLPTQGRLTTCFCTRWGTMHWGIDLAAPLGTPIVAAADGVVLRAGPASGYGNAVYIQDADGNVEIYGHMRYMYVHAGDVVSAGDTIAKVGSEGQSTGPHLHFEIHKGGMNGKPTDPANWLAARGITVG